MDQPRIVFMGTPIFAVSMLKTLLTMPYTVVGVVTQPDRYVGRRRVLTPPPVKTLAQEAGLNVLQPEKIRDKQALEAIADLQPNMIVTAAYGQILPVSLLSMMTLGAYNVHASLLPKYRGGAPIQYAILQGETKTGVTIMTMEKAMDAGAMWAQTVVPIDPVMTYGQLHDELAKKGSQLLKETLPQIIAGALQPVEQDLEKVSFAPTLTRDDEQLNFSQSHQRVFDRIRALCPQPGAFTHLGDKLLKIWYATANASWEGSGDPGQIVAVTPDGPLIACGTGAIIATKVQLEGKSMQSGAEFVRGNRNLVGMMLKNVRESAK